MEGEKKGERERMRHENWGREAEERETHWFEDGSMPGTVDLLLSSCNTHTRAHTHTTHTYTHTCTHTQHKHGEY